MTAEYKACGQTETLLLSNQATQIEKHDLGVIMADVSVIGSLEAKFESTNRIYDVGGV